MNKNKVYTGLSYIFSIISTFPIIVPVFLTMVVLITKGMFLYDYMMPAELFLFTILGGFGVLLIGWINKQSMKKLKLLLIFLILSIINFLTAMAYSILTGLAHGDTEPVGIHFIMIVIFVILWHLFAVAVSIECFRVTKKYTR
ncbi:MAG: hypothetical protein H0Z24_03885 [Thermosipho sp. (in: Bacteria)]|nr:hypothetical protein [Thermosipho sp. (in: thermotogales)]